MSATVGLAVIIAAGGASTRFGTDKLLASLGDAPVIVRAIRAFLERIDVAGVYLASGNPEHTDLCQHPRVTFCPAGDCRAHSVRNALRRIPLSVEWVAVHDAARPLVSQELIDRTLAAALEHGAAVPAMPVSLTIKQAQGPLPARVAATLRRDQLWSMQTPQIMRRRDLSDAFDRCPLPLEKVTDDAQLLELAGMPVMLVPGEERNLKITTPQDLRLAQVLVNATE
jgi:2-C-methyl-D-erythritol 4-phosphate cytidylyltransferase